MTCAQPHKKFLYPLASIAILVFVWHLVVVLKFVPHYLLPSPAEVVVALINEFGLLVMHAQTTLVEALLGLGIGVVLAIIFAIIMDRFEGFYLAFEPLATLSQTIPTIAIAPLLVLWFGYGLLPKIILVILTSFFPVLISLLSGLAAVDPDMIDLMRIMHASRWQIFWHVKIPAALEQFFAGLSIAAAYAIVSAVIAEWLGGVAGLGVYMTRVRKSFAYDRMFASIIIISSLSLLLMAAVRGLAYISMPWKRREPQRIGREAQEKCAANHAKQAPNQAHEQQRNKPR